MSAKRPPKRQYELYAKLIALCSGVDLRGASMPYTSHNGHMFSFMTETGELALRLPSEARESFLKKYKAKLCERHGTVMKEYVVVPDSLLGRLTELQLSFADSLKYARSLKPKATTRIKSSVAKKKKLTKK